jgi:uncharacterized membrane protein YdjX (TVP38/TMEM64 family)/pimeloyl-ACP methyl ester carboxylesterase
MQPYSYSKHLKTVIFLDILLIVSIAVFAGFFWSSVCGESLATCLQFSSDNYWKFLLLSLVRPFVFTPFLVFTLISVNNFGHLWGMFYLLLGSVFSIFIVWPISNIIGKKIIASWLYFHLPKAYHFIRSFDWKIVFFTRLIPFFPFDFLTLVYGALNFRFFYVVLFSILGTIPETLVVFYLYSSEGVLNLYSFFQYCIYTFVFLVIPFLVLEFLERKKGSSTWSLVKQTTKEIQREVFLNNAIIPRRSHIKGKIPVLLLYGFFSSRKSMTILERVLSSKGYEVVTFNLGGILGVFFTRGIIESAKAIDLKLKKFFIRNEVDKVNIVAHSKGGIVALWWILRLGGNKHCNKVITLAAPFRGCWWAWLALFTPLGIFFRDLWQMRPGSNLIKVLNSSKVPENVTIYNLYSDNDMLVRGKNGVFKLEPHKNIIPVPIHFTGHYDMLLRRDVAKVVSDLLGPNNK